MFALLCPSQVQRRCRDNDEEEERRWCSHLGSQRLWAQRGFESVGTPLLKSGRSTHNPKLKGEKQLTSLHSFSFWIPQCHGLHPVRDHGSKAAAAVARPARQQDSGGGGWVQHQPDAGLHLLQHQPGTLSATTRPHVSRWKLTGWNSNVAGGLPSSLVSIFSVFPVCPGYNELSCSHMMLFILGVEGQLTEFLYFTCAQTERFKTQRNCLCSKPSDCLCVT